METVTEWTFVITNREKHLRSENEVQKYCEEHGIQFHANLFDFSDSNLYSGIVRIPNISESENSGSDSDDSDS